MSEQGAPWGRRALLVIALGCALAAVLTGLGRIGVPAPLAARAMDHGPLFVLGVFGTVIALERAVALGVPWAYASPVLGALGGVGVLAQVPGARWSSVGAGLALVLVNVAIVRRQSAAFTWLMLLGSVLLAAGTLGWALGRAVFEVVPAWVAFFVLTILAERLELSRLGRPPPWASKALVGLAVAHAALAGATSLGVEHAPELLGASLVALGLWQLRFDLARRTLRVPGLPRFVALGVLLGSGWLIASGLLLASFGLPRAGPVYDAILHAVLVGFVLSMVFAHAPIILPAVARIEVPFHAALYVPLGLLHTGLVLRLAGDLGGWPDARRAGAIVSAISLALFAAVVVGSRARQLASAPRRSSRR